MAESAVVHIHYALPNYGTRVNTDAVGFALYIVVNNSRKEIISLLNSRKVASEV